MLNPSTCSACRICESLLKSATDREFGGIADSFDNNASQPVADEYQWSLESATEVAVGVEIGDKLQRL